MRVLRWAVNCWLVFHLSAIIIAPASVAPSSELIESAWTVFQPYLEFMYLNHGYHFFAPEPADSTLISFEAERADGTNVTGHIPDPQNRSPPALSPPLHADRASARRATARMRRMSSWMSGSSPTPITSASKYGAVRVKLTGHVHGLPSREDVLNGIKLNDPESYESSEFGVFE